MEEISTLIKFREGFTPTIERLYQRRTYYGLIEGVPNAEINALKLISIKEEAERFFKLEKIYMIQPKEKIISTGTSFNSDNEQKSSLPKVVCMAELSHYIPMHDIEKECSRLGLIWFQEHYAFPISKEILNQIKLLDWGQLSSDEYL